MAEKVIVLGANNNPERYSNKAVKMLLEHGHNVVPVHPREDQVEGIPVVHKLEDINEAIDTITLYVLPQVSEMYQDQILRIAPKRVIFNPGTESNQLMEVLKKENIEPVVGCTLVMLRTGQY